MAVVKNLMVRIGADFSGAKKSLDGATQQLGKFKRDTIRTTSTIRGKQGLGGMGADFKNFSSSVSSSFSRIRGAKGISGVVGELKTLTLASRGSSAAMGGLGVAALSTGARFGIAGVAVAGFTVLLGGMVMGLHKASQPAIKFEADLGRLNMQLKGGSRDFMTWGRSMGLAKQTTAEMGATFGTLLSSFIKDSNQLAEQTKNIVQASRITASATGRAITDVSERMRSGLLGNTEAIEDLGIFVNVSMIESTNAFRKFAGDKSWDQLDFQVQQQIRLAAILEQTYSRYGNELQDNVMTKQEKLMEQLKDIKLHWSQTFLPIWDAVLPALTALAEDVAFVTEKLARFSYWLRGLDYDEATSGSNQQADSVTDLGNSLEETGKQAAGARKELAGFDKLNLLGSGSGSGAGSGGGTGGTGGSSGGTGSGGMNLPELPKLGLVFLPPQPPDAGMGAVATAVVGTVNSMNAEVKLKMAEMWGNIQAQTQMGATGQQVAWNTMNSGIQTSSTATTAQVKLDWKSTLDTMQTDLATAEPVMTSELNQLGESVSSLRDPLTAVQTDWKQTLSYQQQQLNAYRPYLEWGWHLIGASVDNTNPILDDTKASWSSTLSSMQQDTSIQLGLILGDINETTRAWDNLQRTLNTPTIPKAAVSTPIATPAKNPATSGSPSTSPESSWLSDFKSKISASFGNAFSLDALQKTLNTSWEKIKMEAAKPQNQIAASILGAIIPAGKAAPLLKGLGKGALDDVLKALSGLFKGGSGAIPAFAGGAMVYGPTLAMVGDNKGASTNPEVIAPLSDLENIMGGGSDNSEIVNMLKRVEQAVRDLRHIQAVISAGEVTRASIKGINDNSRRSGRNPLTV